jgi:hypothetical protein
MFSEKHATLGFNSVDQNEERVVTALLDRATVNEAAVDPVPVNDSKGSIQAS